MPALKLPLYWEGCLRKCHGRQPDSGNPTVRDETRGLRKRELWWNYEPAAHTERVRVGNSLPVSCARRNSISTRSLQAPCRKKILIDNYEEFWDILKKCG